MIKTIFILFAFSLLLSSNNGIAMITKSKGAVEYKKNSDGSILKRKEITKGLSLYDKDKIVTGANGFAKYIYLDDGSLIKVHKNAEVYVYGAIDKRSIVRDLEKEVARERESERETKQAERWAARQT